MTDHPLQTASLERSGVACSSRKRGWLVGLAFCLLLLDGGTKAWIHHHFVQQWASATDIPVWHHLFGVDFTITYTANKGAAWGWLAQWQGWLLLCRMVTVAVLWGYLWMSKASFLHLFPWLLVASGAVGNILDTLIYGHVIDFLLFTFWGYDFAVFNIADAAISMGVIWILFRGMVR